MKIRSRRLFATLGMIATVSITSSLQGQTPQALTWDPALTGTGSNGSGTWDNTTANWATGTGDVAFGASAQTTNSVVAPIGSTQITVANTAGLAVGQFLGVTQFPAGTTITAIDPVTKVVTLSSASTVQLGANSQIQFSFANEATFGTGSGAAGTITVAGAQAVDKLTLSAPAAGGSYIFSGDSITVGGRNGSNGSIVVNNSATFNAALAWKNISYATGGQTITLNGGTPANTTVGIFNGDVGGTSGAISQTSTLRITGGTYASGGAGHTVNIGDLATRTGGLQFSAGTFTAGGNFQVGTNANDGFVNHTGGTLVLNGQFTAGRNAAGNAGLYVLDGGTINGNSNNNTVFAVARNSGTGTFDMKAGTLNLASGSNAANNSGLDATGTNLGGILAISMADAAGGNGGTGVFNMNGGTATIKEIRFGTTNGPLEGSAGAGSSTLNVNGGTLYLGGNVARTGGAVGEGGIKNYGTGTASYAINLSGGVIGASRNWSSDLNMTLSNTNGGVTFKTTDATGAAHNVTLSGILSGSGTLTKADLGTLTLSGANTYGGGTDILAGAVVANFAGALGVGNVEVGNATLTLNVANIIADTANLYFGTDSLVSLNYTGNDVVNGVINTSTNQSMAAGLWTAAQLNSFFGGSNFSGDGTLTVVIPEPASIPLLGLGLAGAAFVRRRKRA